MSAVKYKTIEEYPGYRIGDDGSVWSCWKLIQHKGRPRGQCAEWIMVEQWRRLKASTDRTGRPRVALGRRLYRSVSRLVLQAFVGPGPIGMECCHFPDANKENCRLENLRWDTHLENMNDNKRCGTVVCGEKHGRAKLTASEVQKIRAMKGSISQNRIAMTFGVSACCISQILLGKKWAHLPADVTRATS